MLQEEKEKNTDNQSVENMDNVSESQENGQKQVSKEVNEVETLKNEVGELKDKYLRLYSEFENFRRRTSKEKLDILKTANEDVIMSLLPVLDDFERAQKAFKESNENNPLKEGMDLIQNKLFKTLESKGLKPMEAMGTAFDSDLHEAITQAPAPSEDLKGKVIDVLEKGYYLNDKVIRHAKVIIGL
jgi:molecular chaperone GrpE